MTDAPLSILILAGGISHEREISLRSGRRVADALTGRGWAVTVAEPDAATLGLISTGSFDVVWPVLHGASGEDGSLRALLEHQGVPFVGSRRTAARLAWDKSVAKTLVGRAGVSTPPWMTLSRETFRELGAPSVLETVRAAQPVPLVVKPVRGGSAHGVSIVREADQLSRAMVEAYTYDNEALVEGFVHGTEISIGVVDTGEGPYALPAVEVQPRTGEYDFEARYNAGETRFFTPARIDDATAARAAEAALAAHEALGLDHLSRIDLIIDADGEPQFLEANVLPGLTETSMLPLGIKATGRDLGDLYAEIARAAALS